MRTTSAEVPANSPGWVDTGIEVEAGQWITLDAVGAAQPAGGPNTLRFAPELFLCYRISPGGDFDKCVGLSTTFQAEHSGVLEFVANFPGAWRDRRGTLDVEAWPREAAVGEYTVGILIRDEEHGYPRPQLPIGWEPVWRVGATGVYRESGDAITCRAKKDGGLIKRPVDVPLTDATRLRWDWRVQSIPSQVAEDSLLTHDYLSIAVEFDNGLDLTYMWSAALPVGTSFGCPLPWWNTHETHQVVRSGSGDLERWLSEEQPVLADYKAAIGGPLPERIVGIWLIAVAVFGDGLGECEYRNIELQ